MTRARAVRLEAGSARETTELLVGEEPMEVRVVDPAGRAVGSIATMRTPGHDFALAAGLLLTEGVIAHRDDIATMRYCAAEADQRYNVVTVSLRRPPRRELSARTLTATASCGVCGTTSIDDLRARVAPVDRPDSVEVSTLLALPAALRASQTAFEKTGGSHAAGLFDRTGGTVVVREDVGRHNALDKAIGELLLGPEPREQVAIAALSGRVSFELIQKVAVARIPVVCAVSAPSSLAVDTADRLGITLVGFVREDRVTVYSRRERILP